MKKLKWFVPTVIASVAIALLCIYIDMAWVSSTKMYSFDEVIATILGNGSWGSNIIILNTNLPRIAIGAVVGMGLAISGAAMQAVFRNPLASPYLLGLSSGASLGAAISLVFFISVIPAFIMTPVLAFATCFLTMVIVYLMARVGGTVRTETLILSGVAMTSLLSALVSLLTYLAGDKLEGIVFWTMGTLGNATWGDILFAAPTILACAAFLLTQAKPLNAMMLGDIHAMDLGINVKTTRLFVLIMVTVVVATAVSFVGVIGFIGLVIPHILRILLGPDNRIIMPMSLFAGAIFLIMCDVIAHVVTPNYGVLPIGVVTSLIGAPVFIYLLIRRKREVGWN